MFKELKELPNFIRKFLSDFKLLLSTPVITRGKSNADQNNKQLTIVSKRQNLYTSYEHHRGSFKCLQSPYK